jgi:hypothetical protein
VKSLTALLIAAIAVVYFFSAKGYLEVLDTQYSVETAFAMLDRHNLLISTDGEGALTLPDGRRYSKYGIGFALSFLPYITVGTLVSQLGHLPRSQIVDFLLSFANIPYAIASLVLFGRLLRKLAVSERTIFWLTLALGLGTLLWRYADYDFSESIQMALLLLAVCGVMRPQKRDVLWAGLAFGLLIVVKLVHIVLLPAFVAYLVFSAPRADRLRQGCVFCFPSLLALAFLAYLNWARFGSPWETGYGGEANQFVPLQVVHTLPALLFSLDKGLLVFCPILVLGFLGWPAFWRAEPALAVFVGGVTGALLLVAAAWYGWDGGWAWGPRLIIPAIPFVLMPSAFLLDAPRHSRWWPAFFVVLALSIVAQVPGILVKDQEIHVIKHGLQKTQLNAVAPSDVSMSWRLFSHKITHAAEIYAAGDFVSPPPAPDPSIDLSSYHTFAGFNVWTEQASRQFHRPIIRLAPLLGFVVLAMLALQAARIRRLSVGRSAAP